MLRALVIVMLASLIACTHTKPTRTPSSLIAEHWVSEESGAVFGPEVLQEELDSKSFWELLQTSQRRGIRQLKFEATDATFVNMSQTEERSIAGDFYLLVGTNFTDTDQTIRRGDYDDIYETARRLSWLKFRVIINLVASVEDLKAALANDRPTIIVWTSHGNTEGFYDFNQIKIPHDIFKNTSPTVYQFILTSCYGFNAIQDVYKPHIPATMKHWAWERLVYHPGDLETFIHGDSWNPFINYPGALTHQGLTCAKEGESYHVQLVREKANFPGSYNSLETCNYIVANSNRYLSCSQDEAGKWLPWSRRLGAHLPIRGFDNHYDCLSRISNVHRNKLCVRLLSDDRFHAFDVTTAVYGQEGFGSANECYAAVTGD
jgi:hypothetical protein